MSAVELRRFAIYCRRMAIQGEQVLDQLRAASRDAPIAYLERLESECLLWIQLATEIDDNLPLIFGQPDHTMPLPIEGFDVPARPESGSGSDEETFTP